ncbi:MAG: response regulator [Deltaproteobacteria bacterium]|nr:response regulator [Deltaproteobacteria bacterium]
MKKILLIEDDAAVRGNTAEILELANYKVVAAENGKRGLQLIKEAKPDLVVCDVMMPELDGYGVLHILSKDPETAGIPFIFLSAKAEKGEIRKGMNLGADDYLTKPFEETELLNAVEARLKKREGLRREFSRDLEGLTRFLDEARGFRELENLSKQFPVAVYKKKETIYQEGDAPRYLFFLNRGKVKTLKLHDEGKEYVTGLYQKGDFFGYGPLLENANYSDSASAFEECEICKIPKEDFLSLVYRNRDVAAKFIKMLSGDVAERERQLLSFAYDSVRKRVAEVLVKLAEGLFRGGGKAARLSIHREDLAAMAGTASETVIRALSDFKQDGYIQIEGRDILVVDPEGLREVR